MLNRTITSIGLLITIMLVATSALAPVILHCKPPQQRTSSSLLAEAPGQTVQTDNDRKKADWIKKPFDEFGPTDVMEDLPRGIPSPRPRQPREIPSPHPRQPREYDWFHTALGQVGEAAMPQKGKQQIRDKDLSALRQTAFHGILLPTQPKKTPLAFDELQYYHPQPASDDERDPLELTTNAFLPDGVSEWFSHSTTNAFLKPDCSSNISVQHNRLEQGSQEWFSQALEEC
jgi:hypothetical protein